MHIEYLDCCGIQELAQINENKGCLTTVLRQATATSSCGAYVFSEAGDGTYATKLAELITKRKLGTIVPIPEFTNPNSLRAVRAFVWVLNRSACLRYRAKHRAARRF